MARITKEKSGLVKIKKDPFLNLLWPGLQMKTYQRLAAAGTSTVVADRWHCVRNIRGIGFVYFQKYWVSVFFKNIGFVYSRKYWVGVFPKVLGISISLESWVLNTQCCALKGKHVLVSGIQAWVLQIGYSFWVPSIVYDIVLWKTEEDIVSFIQKAFSLSSSQSLFVPPGNPDNYCNSPHITFCRSKWPKLDTIEQHINAHHF